MATKESRKTYLHEYYLSHLEILLAQNLEWCRKHRGKSNSYKRKWVTEHHAERLASNKLYRDTHKEEIRAKRNTKQYYDSHRESIRVCVKRYQNAHREKIILDHKKWKAEHVEAIRAYTNRRHARKWKEDPAYRIMFCLRNRIRFLVQAAETPKADHSVELIGCTPMQLKNHLESLFKLDMSWKNYGRHGWHIDHIRPCATFDLTNIKQQRKCFHWTNLQPLWAKENLKKGKKYVA